MQGVGESLPYSITTTPWGASPTSVSYHVYEYVGGTPTSDVTSSVSSGSASVNGDIITLPNIHSLTAGTLYRVVVTFTSGGATYQPWFEILAEV